MAQSFEKYYVQYLKEKESDKSVIIEQQPKTVSFGGQQRPANAGKKWAQEAYAYNALVVAWQEIQSRAAELKAVIPQQLTLEDVFSEN